MPLQADNTGQSFGARSHPYVVAVVLNWNGWQDTLSCLQSLDHLDYPNVDVIVVDNASSDGSVEHIRVARPDRLVLESGANLGYAGGNNIGIRYALEHGANYVWIMNNDTLAAPGALSALVNLGKADRDLGILASRQVTSEIPWHESVPYDCAARREGRRLVMVSCAQPGHQPDCPRHDVDLVTGASLFLRSAMLREIGLLDERYFHYCEEEDLTTRATAAGWRVALACQSLIWHERGSSLPMTSPQGRYYLTRNELLLRRKLKGWSVPRVFVHQPRFAWVTAGSFLGAVRGDWRTTAAVARALVDGMRGRTGPRNLGHHYATAGKRP